MAGHPLAKVDFTNLVAQAVFTAVKYLYAQKVEFIDIDIINECLSKNYPTFYRIYQRGQRDIFVGQAVTKCHPMNFEANYNELRKFSLLRSLMNQGFDVTDIYDPNELDDKEGENKKKDFVKMTTDDILLNFRQKLMSTTLDYTTKAGRDKVKAGGVDLKKFVEDRKNGGSYGLSYSSNFYTTITGGMKPRHFNMISASTGSGKSRISISNICHTFAVEYYDSKLKKFVKNPHGTQNAVLYIGTEMELVDEVEPIMLAYIADVPQDHIMDYAYEGDEYERVLYAIEVLDRSQIYLEYVPDYDLSTLERTIEEYVLQKNVRHVYFDYIHITTDLIAEFQNEAKAKMQLREDQVLANVGTKLKELTRKYDISLDTWTQVSGDWKNENNRDQTIIRGAKALSDKVDCGSIMMRPTVAELRKIEPILKNRFGGKKPNLYIATYKNRGGKHVNVKVWLDVNYSTMRVSDLFCTDYDNKLVDKSWLPETFVSVNEDGIVSYSKHKEDVPIVTGLSSIASINGDTSKLVKPTKYEAIYSDETGGDDPAEKAIKEAMVTGEVTSVVSKKLQNRLDLEKEAEENMYSTKTSREDFENFDDDGWPVDTSDETAESKEE